MCVTVTLTAVTGDSRHAISILIIIIIIPGRYLSVLFYCDRRSISIIEVHSKSPALEPW